jgi:hypothetical protein
MLYRHVKKRSQGSILFLSFALRRSVLHQLPSFIFDQVVFCGSLLAGFTKFGASQSEQCSLASLKNIEESSMAFVLSLLAGRCPARQILEVSHDCLAMGDRRSQQCDCSRRHGLSLNFADNFQDFGMLPLDDKPVRLLAVENPQIDQGFKVRLLVVGAQLISEFQETLLEYRGTECRDS